MIVIVTLRICHLALNNAHLVYVIVLHCNCSFTRGVFLKKLSHLFYKYSSYRLHKNDAITLIPISASIVSYTCFHATTLYRNNCQLKMRCFQHMHYNTQGKPDMMASKHTTRVHLQPASMPYNIIVYPFIACTLIWVLYQRRRFCTLVLSFF